MKSWFARMIAGNIVGGAIGLHLVFIMPACCFAAPDALSAQVGGRVIDFEGTDVHGRSWRPSSTAGRTIAMFFFCGCDACHRLARQWAALDRSGVIDAAAKAPAKLPLTVAVFAGDAEAAKLFASQTRLPANVLIIADADLHATDLYQAGTCPRVFVSGRDGVIRYTNNSADDAPQGHHEQRIAFKALQALRDADH